MAKSTMNAGKMVRSVPTARGAAASVRKESSPGVRDAKPRGQAAAAADAKRGGPRGSAPWAARHAAKHAAEAAARNATPPPPGSARATLRTPQDADELKARLTELSQAIARVRMLKRSLNKDFWEIGSLLVQLSDQRLFEAKGYSSFESFAERELEFGKATAQRLIRIPRVFQEAAAREIGFNGLMTALEAIEGDRESQTRIAVAQPAKPLKPPAAIRS
jgi:hypothetical protein